LSRLVLGIGNHWRGDDGAGVEVARALRRLEPPGMRVLEYEGEPSGLMDAWAGFDDVVLVDAVASGGAPGSLHRLDLRAGPLPAELSGASTHHLGLAEAVELARALDRLPARLELYGIEGGAFDTGRALGPEVQAAVERVASEIAARARP
jgi:hydrogenase maturation protease